MISGPVSSGRPPGLVACPLVPGPVLAPPPRQVPVVEVINVTLAPRDDLLLKVGLRLPSNSLVTVSTAPPAGLASPACHFGHMSTLGNPGVYSIQCAVFSIYCAVCGDTRVQCSI